MSCAHALSRAESHAQAGRQAATIIAQASAIHVRHLNHILSVLCSLEILPLYALLIIYV